MMKKTLCVFVVLALIAQICARPDGKDDVGENAKEQAKTAVKENQDKVDKVNENDYANKAKEIFGNLQNKGKEYAEGLLKQAQRSNGGNGAESKGQQQGFKMSAVIREAEQAGEKMFESGTNMFASFLDIMGL